MASSPSRAEAILAACGAAGDVSKLRSLLNAATAAREEVPEPSLMLHATASAGNAPSVRYLLARYPDVPASQDCTSPPSTATSSHASNPVALAAVKGDVPFLTFLLESGADANLSFFFYRPILAVVTEQHGNSEVAELLRKYGATMEGSCSNLRVDRLEPRILAFTVRMSIGKAGS